MKRAAIPAESLEPSFSYTDSQQTRCEQAQSVKANGDEEKKNNQIFNLNFPTSFTDERDFSF
jgi:hypothetical protein